MAPSIGILYDGAEIAFIDFSLGIIPADQLDIQRFCAGSQHIVGLFENGMVHKKFWNRYVLVIPVFLIKKHDHGFGCSSPFIQQRSIGQGKAGQVTDHGLEIQQTLQSALGYFSLVGGVLGIPAWIFKYIA